MRKRSERLLDSLHHRGRRIFGERRELAEIVAVVPVLRRLLTPTHGVDGRAEALHLHPCVVVVVLARNLVPGERQEARYRVAVRTVPRAGDGDRSRRVRGHHLDLDPLGLARRPRSERCAHGDDLAHRIGDPRVRKPEVDEARPCGLRPLCEPSLDSSRSDLLCDLARWPHLRPRELERDVRRVVAVHRIRGSLELDGSSRDLGELVGEACDGISQPAPRGRRRASRAETSPLPSRRRSRPRLRRGAPRDPASPRTSRRAGGSRR